MASRNSEGDREPESAEGEPGGEMARDAESVGEEGERNDDSKGAVEKRSKSVGWALPPSGKAVSGTKDLPASTSMPETAPNLALASSDEDLQTSTVSSNSDLRSKVTPESPAMVAVDLDSGPAPLALEKAMINDGLKQEPIEPVTSSRLAELEGLVRPFLGRILKLTTSKKYASLRALCKEAQAALDESVADEPEFIEKLRKTLVQGCSLGKPVADVCVNCVLQLLEAGNLGARPDPSVLAVDRGQEALFEEVLNAVAQSSKSRDDALSGRVVRTLNTAVQTSELGVHQNALLHVVMSIYNIYLTSNSAEVKGAARLALERVTNTVFERLEQESIDSPQIADADKSDAGAAAGATTAGSSTVFKDAYNLFKGYCNLSAKELPGSATSDSTTIKWKQLALELVKHVLESAGPVFRSNPKFIAAMRNNLAPALLTNTMSDAMPVVTTSLDIFETLVIRKTFRPILKKEIADIFLAAILRFLESPTAGYARRRAALGLLSTVCSDPQTLTDLFLNYDCDIVSPHLFEKTINCLCSAAQDGLTGPGGTQEAGVSAGPAGELRTQALRVLVLAVESMRAWCSPLEKDATAEIERMEHDGDGEEDAAQPTPASSADAATTAAAAAAAAAAPATPEPRSNGHTPDIGPNGTGDEETERFQKQLRKKRVLEAGVTKFNSKPKGGVEYLVSHGYMDKTAERVAQFLRESAALDATMVGEYLGEADSFAKDVMSKYTQSFHFGKMTFEQALRSFLSSFRLPGEAQKIERIMEEFAKQYHENNPEVFSNADTAFVLSYSTIMLNTDAHNNQVKKKMSKEEFLRNNRGIDDGKDLEGAFLEDIYDRIVQDEIKLRGGVADRASSRASGADAAKQNVQAMDPRRRAELFKQESEKVLSGAKAKFQKRRQEAVEEDAPYFPATNVHIVRLMLETIWCPLLAAISTLLERAGPMDVKTVDYCLEGFRNTIVILSVFSMDMEKDAFVSALSKFTLLNSISEMQKKNVECIRMLLVIAASEGSTLGSQWSWMIRAVVQLELMRTVVAGQPNKYSLDGKAGPGGEGTTSGTTSGATSRRDAAGSGTEPHGVDPNTVMVVNAIKDSEVEKIFVSSPSLTMVGFHDLCSALCKVSAEELREATPVTYCLQRLVEVVLLNVDARTNKQWEKLWDMLANYFTDVLNTKNASTTIYVLESLKQLVWRFLEADEERNFSFQFSLLRPFEMCFSKSSSHDLQQAVLSSVSQVVLARASNVKQGWKAVFAMISMAADDRSEDVMSYGYQICDTLIRKYLGVVDDMFVPAISGIGAYTRTPFSSAVALAAVDHLEIRFASLLAEGKALSAARPIAVDGPDGDEELLFSDTVDAHIQTWFPLLLGITGGITSPLSAVRSAATEALFRVLAENGSRFSSGLWTLFYRGVLSPIFDDVRHLSESSSGNSTEWAMSTGASAMRKLVTVVLISQRTRQLLPDVLDLISSWIVQSSETVAREGVAVFTFMVCYGGPKFSEEDWATILDAYAKFFDKTLPLEITGPAASTQQQQQQGPQQANGHGENEAEATGPGVEPSRANVVDFKVVRAKCVVQLLLTQSVLDTVVVNYGTIDRAHMLRLADLLEGSYVFARDFNANTDLRFALWRSGFMTQVPNLLKQESACVQAFLRILFWLAAEVDAPSARDKKDGVDGTTAPKDAVDPEVSRVGGDPEASRAAQARATECCRAFLSRYADLCETSKERVGRDDARELATRTQIARFIVDSFMSTPPQFFDELLETFFPLFLRLLRRSESVELRDAICDIMERRVSPKLFASSGTAAPAPHVLGPTDLRTLLLEIRDHAKMDKVVAAVKALDGVKHVAVLTEVRQLAVTGTIAVGKVVSAVGTISPGSLFVSGGLAGPNAQPTTPVAPPQSAPNVGSNAL